MWDNKYLIGLVTHPQVSPSSDHLISLERLCAIFSFSEALRLPLSKIVNGFTHAFPVWIKTFSMDVLKPVNAVFQSLLNKISENGQPLFLQEGAACCLAKSRVAVMSPLQLLICFPWNRARHFDIVKQLWCGVRLTIYYRRINVLNAGRRWWRFRDLKTCWIPR